MRSKKVLVNSLFGLIGYLVLMVSNFITRSVFVDSLGLSMAGVDTTFKNFLQVLSLAELGLSTGLIYKLYRPIEEKDNAAIKRVLNFYKRAYKIIALIFMGGALVLSVIVPFFVHDTDKSPLYLGFLFVLYAGDTVASYLFANRKALIVADQNNYLVNRNDAFVSIITAILQITLLYITKSFIVYAVVKIVCRLIGASLIGRKFKKMYPEIAGDKSKDIIGGEERGDLMKNMGAMLCHKIGAVSVTASGSAILSAMISTTMAGVYGNYVLVTNTLLMLIAQVFYGITASFGNVMTVETKEAVYKKFKVLYFFNFLIISFCTTATFVLIQPFMKLWIGNKTDNLFDLGTVVLLICYFYAFGIRRVVLMTKDSAGLFRPDRYFAIFEAVFNIVASVVLVHITKSVNGLIAANLLSILIVPLWTQPKIIYKSIFQRGVGEYYLKYLLYAVITAVVTAGTYYAANCLVRVESVILEILLKGIICVILPILVYVILFYKTEEFKYIIGMIKGLITRKGK